MSEPKKETVRIVLPPRNEGTPVPASPRENAMINLPPKPVLAPLAGAAPIPAPGIPRIPSVPAVPGIPKPPSAPGILKPPSTAGLVKPPAGPQAPVLPSATVAPMAPTPAPVASGGLASGPSPLSSVASGPAPIPPLAKKETSKVGGLGAPTKILPQATVQFKRPSASTSTSRSVSTSAPIIVSKPVDQGSSSEVSPALGGAVLVLAFVGLVVQIMTYLDFKP